MKTTNQYFQIEIYLKNINKLLLGKETIKKISYMNTLVPTCTNEIG